MKSNARTRPACHQHTGRQWIKVSPMGSIRNSSCPEMSCFFEPDMGLKAPLRQPRPVSGSGKRSAVRLPNNGRWHISSRSSLPDKQKPFFTLLSILFSQKNTNRGNSTSTLRSERQKIPGSPFSPHPIEFQQSIRSA